jgi:outer membrane protein TolC
VKQTWANLCVIIILLAPPPVLAEQGSARRNEVSRAEPARQDPKPAIRRETGPQVVEIALTLADAIAMGLRDNRAIRSAYVGRIAQKFDLRVAEDRFTPQFSIGGGAVHRHVAGINSTSAEISPAATMLLPTGATFGLSWVNTLNDGGGIRDRSSTAELSLVQPLLRGGGIDVNMAPVRTARLAEKINKLQLKTTVSETIGQIIFAYRSLLQAQEELKLAQASVTRARELLDMNRALIKAGRMAAVDVVQTEADLENQNIRVLEAIKSLDAARLQLLNLLSLDLGTKLLARESTAPTQITPILARLMPIALAERPDYLGQLLVVEQNKLGIVVAQNEKLWDLSAFANSRLGRENTSGLISSSTRISDVTVGMAFNVPLNDLKRGQPYMQATTTLQTSELHLTTIRQGVELQVRGSVTDVNIRWRQVAAARRAKEFAARAVDIEKEKLKAGRSSNFQVRSMETDLRSAESQQLSTMMGYLNALTTLDLQLGTTLATWRIELKK